MEETMKNIALLINPIAGMGGKVGLKGTDGSDTLQLAIQYGAQPKSEQKAKRALNKLLPLKEKLFFFTASGAMGENILRNLGFNYKVIYEATMSTEKQDTVKFLKALKNEAIDLLMFAGGDGTARDLSEIIPQKIPVVGIPTGVKIHSAVFALSPAKAGQLAYEYLLDGFFPLIDREVIDIDEEAFRKDKIITNLYGYLKVPLVGKHLQQLKSPTPQSEEQAQISAALQIIDDMDENSFYIIGSGSTTQQVLEELNLPSTLLGIDIIKDKQLVAKDVNEEQILKIIDQLPTKLVISPISNQGYILGRGNQQLSDKVLSQIINEDIIILSTPSKLNSLKGRPLLVYTGNEQLDLRLSSYYRVITGYGQYAMHKVISLEN